MKKRRIVTIDDLLSSDVKTSLPFGMVIRAIKTASRAIQNKAYKEAEKILGEKEVWGEGEWMDFEEMRKQFSERHIITTNLRFVASPVEVWMIIGDYSYEAAFIQSLLTGESCYATKSSGSWLMAIPNKKNNLAKTRTITSSLSGPTVEALRNADKEPVSELIKALIDYAGI